MIIDHVGLTVSDYEKSKQFYTQALAPLNIAYVRDVGGWAGFGKDSVAEFWFGVRETPQPSHVGFLAQTREQVRQFHKAAIAAGGVEKSPPAIFDVYHPNFYAALVYDPDGHNIEVVCHAEGES